VSSTLDRPVELVGFSVFHSVQCGSVSSRPSALYGHGVPPRKAEGERRSPAFPLNQLQPAKFITSKLYVCKR